MSNPNHIIIPIVKNKPTLEELNVFQSTTLCLTPQKEAPLSKLLVDKKYSSAFKRYKQKKQKREHNGEELQRNQPSGVMDKQKKPLKIKIRHMEEPAINKNIQQLYNFSVKFGFYDPNQAPLYASDSNPNPQLPRNTHPFLEKTERMQEEIQVQLQQKLKIEPIEQEIQVKYVEVNYRDDDPFIIIKKTNTKKVKSLRTDTSNKTKIIKKDENCEKKNNPCKKKHAGLSDAAKILVIRDFTDPKRLSPELKLLQRPKQVKEEVKLSQSSEILHLEKMLKTAQVVDQKCQANEELSPILISQADVMS